MAEMAVVREGKNLGRRLVLFPSPFQGHINPMFQLASLLYARGFSITIFHTNFNSPDPTNYPDFDFVPIADEIPDEVASTHDLVSLIEELNANIEEPFRDRMAGMLSQQGTAGREAIACVIVDALLYSTRAVVEKLGVPRLVLRTNSAACFNVFVALPLLWERESQLEIPVRELPPLRVRDLPHITGSSVQSLCQLITQIVEEIRTSSGVIWNTFTALERTDLEKMEQELFDVPAFVIGPLHKFSPNTTNSLLAQDRSCMKWLDQQAPRSVLYVSFGSLACMDGEELLETAWGLANSHQPFLWVVRQDSVRGSELVELPEEFEEVTRGRGRIVKWAPQPEVLAHPAVGGFWTHCGWNSTLESICEGVPMLCWPCFGDQMGNARFVSHVWKVGIRLENGLERGKIEMGIRKLMTEKEGVEIRERARDLKQSAYRCIKKGGSSYETFDKLVDYLVILE